jgi:hypothetical protein
MSLTNPTRPNAPIPGANYTSDTRNWPWHRPPDITDIDEALEYVIETLTETDAGMRYMGLIESEVPLVSVADIIVTLGIGRGKWTPDFALLIAGPVTRLLEIMAKAYNIEYDIGIDDEPDITTSVVYKKAMELSSPSEEETEEVEEVEEVIKEETQGFMIAAPEEEQESMLGYDIEEEEVE